MYRSAVHVGWVFIVTIILFSTQAFANSAVELWFSIDDPQCSNTTDEQLTQFITHAVTASPDIVDDICVNNLRRSIDTHQTLEQMRQTETQIAYQEKLDKIVADKESGDLNNALTSAVEAFGLAIDRDSFVNEPLILDLVILAEKQASKYEADRNWFEAQALYKRLELLFEYQDRYSDQYKRVSRRLQLIRTYAPKQWFEMKLGYAEKHGQDEPKRWSGDKETWQKKLENIDISMLLQAIVYQERKHVENVSYDKIITGGIDALLELLDTEQLTETFPSLADYDKVNAYTKYLTDLKTTIGARTTPMSYSPTTRDMVREIFSHNTQTINLPEEVIAYEFGEGATGILDKYSSVIWPNEKSLFDRNMSGKFTGVGIWIVLKDDFLTIVSPLEDTPAHHAGIKADDRIVTIDGRDTAGITLVQAIDQITGPEGTMVMLGIKRDGHDGIIEIQIKRETIRIFSVKGWSRENGGTWNYYIDPVFKIGYIRLTQFHDTSVDELDKAIQHMCNTDGLNGLILDLRFNPGGLLTSAINIADRFIDSGIIVSTREFKARADRKKTYAGFPMVVLINRTSASASEIVSGCLQDHGKALIVGEQSYGKGSVQQVYSIGAKQAAIKVTTQYYRLPSGRIIHRRPKAKTWGIIPDVQVMMTDQQVADWLKARRSLDVLRETNTTNTTNTLPTTSKTSQNTDFVNDDDKTTITTADEILARGLDPQLETAILLLKAKIISESQKEIKISQGE